MNTISVDTEIKRNQLLTRAMSAASMLLSATRAAANRAKRAMGAADDGEAA